VALKPEPMGFLLDELGTEHYVHLTLEDGAVNLLLHEGGEVKVDVQQLQNALNYARQDASPTPYGITASPSTSGYR
jgi:hypothetical protein